MAEHKVVRSVGQKIGSGENFQVIKSYFGSEPRFVTPIKNTNLNSLEEQLLLGHSVIITEWTENNGNKRITQEFRSSGEEPADGYYILETTIYAESNVDVRPATDVYVLEDINTLVLNTSGNEVSGTTLTLGNTAITSVDSKSVLILTPQEIILPMVVYNELLFKTPNTEATVIAKKETLQYSNSEGKKVTEEKITYIASEL